MRYNVRLVAQQQIIQTVQSAGLIINPGDIYEEKSVSVMGRHPDALPDMEYLTTLQTAGLCLTVGVKEQ